MVTGHGQTMLTWSCLGTVFNNFALQLFNQELPENVCGRVKLGPLLFFSNLEFRW